MQGVNKFFGSPYWWRILLCFIDANFFLLLTKTNFFALLKKNERKVTLIECFLNFHKIFRYFIAASLDDNKALKTTFNLKKNKICFHYCHSINNRKSCRWYRKKITLKTEVRKLKKLIKNVYVFNINILNSVFSFPIRYIKWNNKFHWFVAWKWIFFPHGNGFTPVWLVGTEKNSF